MNNNPSAAQRDYYAGNLSHRSNQSHSTTIIGGDIAAKMTTYRRAYAGTLDEEIGNLMNHGRGTPSMGG